MWRLFKTNATVAARFRARFVEVYEYFRVAKCAHTSVTDGSAAVNNPYGLTRNHLHSALGVWLKFQVSLLEARRLVDFLS